MIALRRRTVGVAVLLVLVLPWVLDRLIVTDQERVEDLFRELAAAASQQDLDQVLPLLTTDFVSAAPRLRAADPEELRERVQRAWTGLEEVRLEFDQVTFEGDRPAVEAEVTGWLFLRGRGMQGGGLLKARCELRFGVDGIWRVAALRSIDFSGGF